MAMNTLIPFKLVSISTCAINGAARSSTWSHPAPAGPSADTAESERPVGGDFTYLPGGSYGQKSLHG